MGKLGVDGPALNPMLSSSRLADAMANESLLQELGLGAYVPFSFSSRQ